MPEVRSQFLTRQKSLPFLFLQLSPGTVFHRTSRILHIPHSLIANEQVHPQKKSLFWMVRFTTSMIETFLRSTRMLPSLKLYCTRFDMSGRYIRSCYGPTQGKALQDTISKVQRQPHTSTKATNISRCQLAQLAKASKMNKDALIRTMKRQTWTYTDITKAILKLHGECLVTAVDEYNNEPSLTTRFGTVQKPFVERLFIVDGPKSQHLDLDPDKDSDWNLIREQNNVETLTEEMQKGQRNCAYVEFHLEVLRNATRWWRDRLADFKAGR